MSTTKANKITLSEIMYGSWTERAVETCKERGIPSTADGMKPVQRFLVCQGYKTARDKFCKVSGMAGAIAALGYNHGDAANAALISMTAYHSNNLPLFIGDGNFGNVLDAEASSPRYIFVEQAPYINYILKDTELAPENPDREIQTPLYYLPIIPLCLVNGIKGIATGYATNIPPHSVVSIIDNLIRMTEGKDITEIKPRYYKFSGTVTRDKDHYVLTGTYEKKSPIHYVVTDLPPLFYDSSSYENVLKGLVEKGIIASYDNMSCNDKFEYDVYLKKGTRWNDDEVIDNLKLRCNHFWNLTTIMPDSKLKIWNKETGIEDIVRWFYDFRIPFVQQRINNKIDELSADISYYKGFINFIEDFISGKIKLKNIDEEQFKNLLITKYQIPDGYVNRLMDAPVRTFTTSKIETLRKKYENVMNEYEYYTHTTKEKEYRKDLEELKKVANILEK